MPGSFSSTVISTPTPPVTAEGKPETNEGAALSLVENWSFTTFPSPWRFGGEKSSSATTYTSYFVPALSAAAVVSTATTVSAAVTFTLAASAAETPPGPAPARISAAEGVCLSVPSVYPAWYVWSRRSTT